jgi:hypothetical protein
VSQDGACAEYVHWYSGIEHDAAGAWHVVRSAATYAYHAIRRYGGDAVKGIEYAYDASDAKDCFGGDTCEALGNDIGGL